MTKKTDKKDNTALIDCDGTIADYTKSKAILDKVYMTADPTLTEKELKRKVQNTPGFWENLERIDNGFKVLELLQEIGFDLHVLTKAPRNCVTAWTGKAKWCYEHLPEGTEITITTHYKHLMYGKVLFDDWPKYIKKWLIHRPRGQVIMLDQPWNQGFEHDNVFRVDQNDIYGSLDKLRPILKKVYAR